MDSEEGLKIPQSSNSTQHRESELRRALLEIQNDPNLSAKDKAQKMQVIICKSVFYR